MFNILSGYTKMQLKRVFISLLLGLMVFSTFSFSPTASALVETSGLNTASITTAVSGANKVVTVSFSVYGEQKAEDLKAAITVKRSDASAYSALGAADTVSFSNNLLPNPGTASLVVTFDNELTGSVNSIQIAGNALKDSSGVANTVISIDSIVGRDITPPLYVGSNSNNGNNLYLDFDENFSINSGEEVSATYLRSKMSIATDGVNFVPLLEQGQVYQYDSNTIRINYTNDMKVILGTNTLIKITGGTLKDGVGNLNAEMIFDVTPPVIQSAEISSDNHDVTITFHENVLDNTNNTLKTYIYLLKNSSSNSYLKPLGVGDTVSIVSGKLVIHFAEALSGANNQIRINGGALKDSYGNVRNEDNSTAMFQANAGVIDPADTTTPRYVESYITNSNHDITLVFDEDVSNNMGSVESLINAIRKYNPSSDNWEVMSPIPDLTFSGHTITLHFAAQLSGSQYYLIPADSIKDLAGNAIHNQFESEWMNPVQPLSLEDGGFSNNSRWLNLSFNSELVDNTIVQGISHLKEKITIVTDPGTPFSALDEQDVVSIYQNRIIILFHDAKKKGTIRVKVAADALSDLHGNVQNAAIDQVIAYNTPDITGYFFSNAASEFLFEDNDIWRSKVKDIILYSNEVNANRRLNSSEYTLTAGKLTINQGVFKKDGYYYISILADGYSGKEVDGRAVASSEIYYMSAPKITTVGGITATLDVLKNYSNNHTGTQTVVFELMNGTTPVSIVTADLKVDTGTYSANFNVTDAATNHNYTVRAFIVNKYDTDFTSVGTNLATQVTQAELDILKIKQGNNGYDGP
jgi:hypothetical protein